MTNDIPQISIETKLDKETYLGQLKKKYGERDDRKKAFALETDTVWQYFEAVSKQLEENYEITKILAVGGTGIVHIGNHKRFPQPIVIKINRPNVGAEEKSMVENEANILPTFSHPNIIGVLDRGRFCVHKDKICLCENTSKPCKHKEECGTVPKLTYIVEPYIDGSKPFFTHDPDPENVQKTWLYAKVEQLKSTLPEALVLGQGDDTGQAAKLVNSLLDDIAKLFSQWIRLLRYIGTRNYVYLDVKPENVLVDEHLHLTAIDFGSVEKIDLEDQTPIDVFFTERYAHPNLFERIKDKASSNRVRGGIKRAELRRPFDYYALGISMLEILNEIANVRPHAIPQMPLYRSLHFLATRLLDKHNSTREGTDMYAFASQVFPGLSGRDYRNLAYDNLDDVHRDIRKERGRWNLEVEVPELATYSKDIVRIVPAFNTVLTARLRGVIEHPLVARLKYVTQLGLVSLVYPTADHARYDHSLGSYTYTTYYVKSLFNDLGNPIFRNLVGAEDINAVLLAALLHDLGQYPLAHDLEEVHPGIFKHGKVGEYLLKDPLPDQRGRTLRNIIEDAENGWGINYDVLTRILGSKSDGKSDDAGSESFENQFQEISFKISVLAAIIDGQIDADKADYIIRDSVRCGLPYGAQLDVERLLRVLTVAVLPEDDPKRRIALGVYDKGLVSAHAFGQARYQLLSTVYWHHTARIIKAMLQYATAMALPQNVFNEVDAVSLPLITQIREQLLSFIKSLVPPFAVDGVPESVSLSKYEPSLDLSAEPSGEVIDTIFENSDPNEGDTSKNAWYPGISWTDWLMLRWIANLPDNTDQSLNLIHAIQTRKLYKRVITLSHEEHPELVAELAELSWPKRVKLCKKLHESVFNRLSKEWDKIDTATTMTNSDFDKLSQTELLIIIDIPRADKKIGYDRPLGVVPELKEKSYQQDSRKAHDDKPWQEIMAKMIKGIAPVRVLCHPDVRNLIGSKYTPLDMQKLILRHLKELN